MPNKWHGLDAVGELGVGLFALIVSFFSLLLYKLTHRKEYAAYKEKIKRENIRCEDCDNFIENGRCKHAIDLRRNSGECCTEDHLNFYTDVKAKFQRYALDPSWCGPYAKHFKPKIGG